MSRFEAAPWPAGLKVTSALATVILAVASYVLFRAFPRGTHVPFAESFGAAIATVPLAIALISLLFVVSGYELEPGELRVQRLLWSTRISLDGITRASHDPQAMRRSLRLFGNGGLFAITGFYRNRALGNYRAFATDPRRAVILFLPRRVIVVSPADPAGFLRELAAFFPAVSVDVGDRSGNSKGPTSGSFS